MSVEWTCPARETADALSCRCQQCTTVRQREQEWSREAFFGGLVIALHYGMIESMARGCDFNPILREYMTKEDYVRYQRDLSKWIREQILPGASIQ